jgi:hypothetical protein
MDVGRGAEKTPGEAARQRRQPQPAYTVPQPGSMEWFAEQKKRK